MERSDWTDPLTVSPPGDQMKAEPPGRMWAEPEAGPSRCEASGQGYCGYCRVLYTHLDQHLSSLRHLDSVQASSRGSAPLPVSEGRLTLLERFLLDVQKHHPHRYSDPRPSHADLPSVSALPLPRAELDELCASDEASKSLGTRDLPSSDDKSSQERASSQSGEGAPQGGRGDRGTLQTCSKIPPPQPQAPPTVHKKAHRKTNRRKASESSSSTQAPWGPLLQAPLDTSKRHRTPIDPRPLASIRPRPPVRSDQRLPAPTDPRPPGPSDLEPFLSWRKERRRVQVRAAFSADMDPVEETIEEVIQKCCRDSPHHHQEEVESLHISLPVSMETPSEDWDAPVQVAFQRTPVQVQTGVRDLGRLTDVQVDVADRAYAAQLDSALLGGGPPNQGFWDLPIEQVLPVPEHFPESFRGKTWAQIEQEDKMKVERLVQQFRRGTFVCYFDSESLARFGRGSRKTKEATEAQEAELDAGVLPLEDQNEDFSECVRMRNKRRGIRLASRCQVVKVSHSTQTLRLVIPTVHQPPPEAPPTSLPSANERTPETQTWHSLPPSYSGVVTPVQPRTSLVYLLCSPSCCSPQALGGSAPKRCRKRRRAVDLQRLKVKYKRLPVKFYEPGTNQILRNPPQGPFRARGPAPSSEPPPPCVRQLFRSLSPDLNMDRQPGEGPKGDPALMSAPSTNSRTGRRRVRVSQAPPTTYRTQRERGGRPRPSQRRTRNQATPPPTRREGLRRTAYNRKLLSSPGPALQPCRRGRSQRGRGCGRGGGGQVRSSP